MPQTLLSGLMDYGLEARRVQEGDTPMWLVGLLGCFIVGWGFLFYGPLQLEG